MHHCLWEHDLQGKLSAVDQKGQNFPLYATMNIMSTSTGVPG